MQRNLLTSIYFEKQNIYVNVYHEFNDGIEGLTKYEEYTFSVINKKSLYSYSLTFNRNFNVNSAIEDIIKNKDELDSNNINIVDFYSKVKEICYKYKQ